MRLCLLCCSLLLSGCMGADGPQIFAPPPVVPDDLLRGCAGYQGPFPATDGQASDAWVAEARGRVCANGRIEAIREILGRG